MYTKIAAVLLLMSFSWSAGAETLLECSQIEDAAKRVACYDQLAGRVEEKMEEKHEGTTQQRVEARTESIAEEAMDLDILNSILLWIVIIVVIVIVVIILIIWVVAKAVNDDDVPISQHYAPPPPPVYAYPPPPVAEAAPQPGTRLGDGHRKGPGDRLRSQRGTG